jgi:putative hydrolase of the HAD superfamily
MIDTIAFDADDTLWQNEPFYERGEERFAEILNRYGESDHILHALHETETRNLDVYGYGIKSFVLSMVETALEVSGKRACGEEIAQILEIAKNMMVSELDLFEHAEPVLVELSPKYTLILLTKGDTFEQEKKVQRSGLVQYFHHVEIVADKTADSYRALLNKYHIEPRRFLMVGNSLRSDILPVVEIGAKAVYIPYANTWSHESMVDMQAFKGEFAELEHLGMLPAYLEGLNTP